MATDRYSSFSISLPVPGTTDGSTYESGLPFLEIQYTGRIKMHKVELHEVGRPDVIAWKELKDADLWWVVLKHNMQNGIIEKVNDCTMGLKVGMVLEMPIDFTMNMVLPFMYKQD